MCCGGAASWVCTCLTKHILRGARIFVIDEVAQLSLVQRTAEVPAEIGQRSCPAQHTVDPRAIGARQPQQHFGRYPGIAFTRLPQETSEIGIGHVAARKRRMGGPVAPRQRHHLAQLFQRMFGQLAVGGDLAAIDRQDGRPVLRVEFEHVVAGHGRIACGIVFVQRAHASIGGHDFLFRHRAGEIARGRFAQIAGLLGRDRDGVEIALI